jgi:hypothetical protein
VHSQLQLHGFLYCILGSRGDGCYLFDRIFACTKKVSERLKPFGARDVRYCDSENRLGSLSGRATTSRQHNHRAPVRIGLCLLRAAASLTLTIFRTYTSVDPAPPNSSLLAGKSGTATVSSIEELRLKLLDTQLPLFERYRAMFALRNIGSPSAVDALAAGFSDDSVLFK